MPGYQQTIIIGHVGRDPELRYTKTGVAVCDFSVAVTRKWTEREGGERREETTWFRVSAWRGLAETCNQYVHKGMPIMVTGRVAVDAYTAQDGTPRASLELTAQEVQFLGRRGESDGAPERREEPEEFPF